MHLSIRERTLALLNKLPAPILDGFAHVLFGRALMLCTSCGIFDALQTSRLSAGEIAERVGLSKRGTEVLLQAMEAGGYIRRDGERYWNSKIAERWLTRASPRYVGNLVRYFETLFRRWEFLDETARRGEPQKPYFEYFTDEDWEIYTYGMMDLARILMPDVLKAVRLPPSARRLLDIGGSHGLYSIELCRRYPSLTAEVLDFDKAVRVGKKITEEYGMSDRVTHRVVDFKNDDFGNEYDVVLAFNIVHGLTPSENSSLLKKTYKAMANDGLLFIMDQMRDGRSGRSLSGLIPAIVGLNLFNEIGGNAYSIREIQEWCTAAGFVGCRVKKLRAPGVAIVKAQKP